MKKSLDWWLRNNSQYNYVSLPTAPSKTDGTLLDISMGSTISQAELGTDIKKGLVPASYANMLRPLQLVGTEGAPYIFRPDSDTDYAIIDGSALANGAVMLGQSGATISDWIEFHKLITIGNTGVSSNFGFKWAGKAGGSNVKLSDIVINLPMSAASQFNGDGDAGTYGNMRFEFVRIFGNNQENEAFYNGDTTVATGGTTNTVTYNHAFATNVGWDGWQGNRIQNLTLRNLTTYDVGKAARSGQKSHIQIQDAGNGALVENCLLWLAPQAFQVAARDITFRKCVFYSTEEGFYQDVVTQAGYASPLSSVGGTITFDQCEFYSVGSRTNGFSFNENNANLVLTNCKRGSNVTRLVQDDRTDKITYSITETGTTVGTPVTPTFTNLDYSLPLTHGCVTNDYYRANNIGFRN